MLVCPYCSLSNPETNLSCMGCGRELPPDASLGASLSEMSKWYPPTEIEHSSSSSTNGSVGLALPSSSTPATSVMSSTSNLATNAVVNAHSAVASIKDLAPGVKEHTGRFSLVVSSEQDSDVLGDMEAALNHLLLEDTGVGQTDDDAELMLRPPHLESKQKISTSSRPAESFQPTHPSPVNPERHSFVPSAQTSASDASQPVDIVSLPTSPETVHSPDSFPDPDTAVQRSTNSAPSGAVLSMSSTSELHRPHLPKDAEPTVEFAPKDHLPTTSSAPLFSSPTELLEKASSSRSEERTTINPFGLSDWRNLESAGSARGDEATKIQRKSSHSAGISLEQIEPGLHRPAPTDRIDLRELQSMLTVSQSEGVTSEPHTHATAGTDSSVRFPARDSEWDVDTSRENVLSDVEPEEILELDAESLVEDDWHDTPHPMSSSALDAALEKADQEAQEDDAMEHTLGRMYTHRTTESQGANPVTTLVGKGGHRPEPTWENFPTQNQIPSGADSDIASHAQRWITPDLGPFAVNDTPETVSGRRNERSGSEPTATSIPSPHGAAWEQNAASSMSMVYVIWQLEVESVKSDAPLRQGQRLHILKGLAEVVVRELHALGLEVCEVQEDRIVARHELARGGISRSVQTSLHLLREVIQRHEPPLMARLRGRCVVVTLSSGSSASAEEAVLLAQRLLRGMPVDRIWLSWSSHQAWSEPQYCQEVVLPSLEEPAYEIEESRLWPGEQETSPEAPVQTPWVGQENALASLHHAWNRVVQGSPCQVLVLGEPGSGRTRLAEVWHQQILRVGLWFAGGASWCASHAGESPYLASLLQSHVQSLGLQSTAQLAERIRDMSRKSGASPVPEETEYIHALLELWTDTRGSLTQQAQQAQALAWFMRLSTQIAPIVLVFDDLFLLDHPSLQLLQNLLRQPLARCMLLVLSNPGEYEEILFSSLPDALRVELKPLHPQECYQLVESLWPESAQHREQSARLIEQSEGNPRILLSLLQQHIQPHTRTRELTWSHHPSLPPQMEASLLRRLRQLTSLEQDTLRKAAVVGDRFWKGCIEALERLDIRDGQWGLQDGVVISHVDDRRESLAQLQQKGLIESVVNSAISGEQEYRFQHRLLRNLCVRQLPWSVRQRMHRWVAQWLQVRDREQSLIPERARHLKLAGQAEEAARHLLYAAQDAFAWGRCRHALSLLSENMEEGELQSPLLQLQSFFVAGEIYEHIGDRNAAQRLYQSALQRSWQLTDSVWGARIFLKVAGCEAWKGHLAAASGAARNAQTLAQLTDETPLVYQCHLSLARFALLEGQVAKAFEHIKQLQSMFSEHTPLTERAHCLSTLGWMYRSEGRWADSVQKLQEAHQLFEEANQPLSSAATLMQLGDFFLAVGDDANALPLLEQAMALLRPREAYGLLVQVLGHAAHVALRQRNVQQAQVWLQEAWQHARESGDSSLIAPIAAALSAVAILVRQSKDALRYARIASQKLPEISASARARTYHFLGEAASGMPPQYAQQIFEQPPTQLPEGGIITYCYLKAVEMFKHVGDAANQLTSLLALTRALFICGFARTSAHILERGVSDARQLGLGLLLEQMANQQRLISGGDNAQLEDASIPAHQSTMVVRQKKNQSPAAFPGAPTAPVISTATGGVVSSAVHGSSGTDTTPDKTGDRWQSASAQEDRSHRDRHTQILSGPRPALGSEPGHHSAHPVRLPASVPRPSSPPPKKK